MSDYIKRLIHKIKSIDSVSVWVIGVLIAYTIILSLIMLMCSEGMIVYLIREEKPMANGEEQEYEHID